MGILDRLNGKSLRAKIARLNGREHHKTIVSLSYKYRFPFDHRRATEQALFRTFAIPSISTILWQAGELVNRTQKRYDDTDILLSHILEHGYDSPEAKRVFATIRRAHSHYPITQDQYRYVLGTFVMEPIRWNKRFGYQPLTKGETDAIFQFWLKVGERMGIEALPETFEHMAESYEGYEQQWMVYDETNAKLAQAVFDGLLKSWPRFLRPILMATIRSVLDDRLLSALGMTPTSRGSQKLTAFLLRLAGRCSAMWHSLRPYSLLDRRRPSYPRGFTFEQLGPPRPIRDGSRTTGKSSPESLFPHQL